jgi:hypothetical protein
MAKLVDAVYDPVRKLSPIAKIIDELIETLDQVDEVNSAMVLDIIAMRWLLADVLLGQGYNLGRVATFELNPWQEVEVLHD